MHTNSMHQKPCIEAIHSTYIPELRMAGVQNRVLIMTSEIDAAYFAADMKRAATGKFGKEHRTHERLRIVAGSIANKRLLSSQGEVTRPMMEKVRSAIFDMVLGQASAHCGFMKALRNAWAFA